LAGSGLQGESLESLRKRLDEINLQLLKWLNERAAVVEKIGQLKEKQGVERYDPVREAEMLAKLVEMNEGPFDDATIRHLFKEIFKASLHLQKDDSKEALLVSRKRKPTNTHVPIGDVVLGEPHAPAIVAGPCSVETEEQVRAVAEALVRHGVKLLRGGAFKPRTSPYDFQGLGIEGLRILRRVADEFGLYVISEVMTPGDLEQASEYVDVIQIGARNMQNFSLLKEAGKMRKPILLKRGLAATMEEFMYAAEYILSQGNEYVMLIERGIRTYEKATRNTLDISAVPILKQETHLPVLVDISHSTGRRDIVLPIAKAALAAGADGIMVEVHPNPAVALSDANQQVDLAQFADLMKGLQEAGFIEKPSVVKA